MKTHYAILLSLTVAGCGTDVAHADASRADDPADSATAEAVATAYTVSSVRVIVPKKVAWTVNFDGAGPMHPGMPLTRAVMAMGGDFWQLDRSVTCSYFRSASAPGMKFLFLNRKLARIEVESRDFKTSEGLKVGSTEEQVLATYPDRVTVSDDTFTGGHFLSVRPPEGADTLLRMVFETDTNKRVTRYRTGVRYATEWAEGCS